MSAIKSEYTYWQDAGRSEKITKLLDIGLLADCKFVVGPEDATAETIIGHKVMFILESPVLERMLTGNFVEAEKDKEIRITDVDPNDFKNFRYLVYNNDSSNLSKFTFEEIMNLYRVSDKYMSLSICQKCINFLKSSLKGLPLDRLITLFDFACGLEDKHLQAAIEMCISNCREVLMGDKLNELSSKVFYDYVLFVSKLPTPPKPIIIFNAIDSYFKHNRLMGKYENETNMDKNADLKDKNDVDNIHSFKRMLLNLVKFDAMLPEEFISGTEQSDLLEAQIKFDILSSLCTQDVEEPQDMPLNYGF
ncbi:uncharacterized protein LOC135955111 [Calliphora vicina]|uniref:uncharacterized protein LOC135955111 n=1 Tax=Calliphora vicina TaxID=7373 RepID=UPI00325B1C5A